MADAPEGTRLLGDPEYPTLAVENVVMLPGAAASSSGSSSTRWRRSSTAPPFRLATVYLSEREEASRCRWRRWPRAHPGVELGSYPRFDQGADHRVGSPSSRGTPARSPPRSSALLAVLPREWVVRAEAVAEVGRGSPCPLRRSPPGASAGARSAPRWRRSSSRAWASGCAPSAAGGRRGPACGRSRRGGAGRARSATSPHSDQAGAIGGGRRRGAPGGEVRRGPQVGEGAGRLVQRATGLARERLLEPPGAVLPEAVPAR